jgi:hypothetical protein
VLLFVSQGPRMRWALASDSQFPLKIQECEMCWCPASASQVLGL